MLAWITSSLAVVHELDDVVEESEELFVLTDMFDTSLLLCKLVLLSSMSSSSSVIDDLEEHFEEQLLFLLIS